MKSAAQIFDFDQARQLPFFGRVDLPVIFAQFRRDKVESQRAIKLRLIANLLTPDFRPEKEDSVAIGKRVRVLFQDISDDFALPQFTLTDEPPVGRVWRLPG